MPNSILSKIILCVIFFFISLHPVIKILRPTILIFPPNLFKKIIRSLISGSIAQLVSIVFPLALNAAHIAFSVAPTEITGKLILAPFNPFFASAIIYPFFILIFAPS